MHSFNQLRQVKVVETVDLPCRTQSRLAGGSGSVRGGEERRSLSMLRRDSKWVEEERGVGVVLVLC